MCFVIVNVVVSLVVHVIVAFWVGKLQKRRQSAFKCGAKHGDGCYEYSIAFVHRSFGENERRSLARISNFIRDAKLRVGRAL